MNSLRLILSNYQYFSPAWVFASVNIIMGTWVLYLPHIKIKLSLNDAEIGIALFCLALGILLSISFVPYFNKRFGVGRSTKFGILLFALLFNFPLISPNYILLCSSLFFCGIFSGFTDVSMNALVSIIEKRDTKHFMSAAHGFFSLGGFIGAGLGSLILVYFSNPFWHMLSISCVILFTNLALSKNYQSVKEINTEQDKEKGNLKNLKLLIGLSIVAFIIMSNEGAVEHWSNLYLFEIVNVSEYKAGAGFIAFSFTMTLGRFMGDEISKKIGSINIIMLGCLIAALGYMFILTANLYSTVIGFGILGLGLSVIVPELFRLASQTRGVNASVGISIVSGIGFIGFLIGPVLIGFISNASSLKTSYIFLMILIIIAILLSFFHLKKIYKD